MRLFTRKLIAATKKTINIYLELISFGMSSTLISFDGKYYEYHGGKNGKQGLAIGRYESDFLSDLVASYLFEKSNLKFCPTACIHTYLIQHWTYVQNFLGNLSTIFGKIRKKGVKNVITMLITLSVLHLVASMTICLDDKCIL